MSLDFVEAIPSKDRLTQSCCPFHRERLAEGCRPESEKVQALPTRSTTQLRIQSPVSSDTPILTNCSDDDNDLPNNNFFTSTPSKDKIPPIFSSKVKKVKIMIMNCNGVKGPSKQAAFLAALDIHRPDVVLGCE